MVRWSACTVLVILTGCGLTVVGREAPDDDDAAAPTALADGGPAADRPPQSPPVATCTAQGSACSAGLPEGFRPFALAAGGACPIDFESADVVAEPAAGPDACTCSCAIDPDDPPSFSTGGRSPATRASSPR